MQGGILIRLFRKLPVLEDGGSLYSLDVSGLDCLSDCFEVVGSQRGVIRDLWAPRTSPI